MESFDEFIIVISIAAVPAGYSFCVVCTVTSSLAGFIRTPIETSAMHSNNKTVALVFQPVVSGDTPP